MIAHHAFAFQNRVPADSPISSIFYEGAIFPKLCELGNICVAIFLFITGIGLASSAGKPFLATAKKSFLGFEKIYLPCVLIGGALLLFFPVDYPNDCVHFVTLKNIGKAMLGRGSKICGEWWYAALFLTALICYFPVCRVVFSKIGNSFLASTKALALLFALFGLVYLASKTHIPPRLPYLNYFPVFVLGYFAGTQNFSGSACVSVVRNFRTRSFLFRLALACLSFLACAGGVVVFWKISLPRMLILLAGTLFVVWLLVSEKMLAGKILAFLGKYSGLMWLNHSFFLYYYFRHEIYALPSVVLVFVVTCAVSLAAAMVMRWAFNAFWKIFERKKRAG